MLLALFAACLVIAQTSGLPGLVKYTPPPGFKRDDKRAPEGRIAFFAPDHHFLNFSSPNTWAKMISISIWVAAELG